MRDHDLEKVIASDRIKLIHSCLSIVNLKQIKACLSRHSGKIHEHGRFSCESCTHQTTERVEILVNSVIKGSF